MKFRTSKVKSSPVSKMETVDMVYPEHDYTLAKRRRRKQEEETQIAFVGWMNWKHPKIKFTASANGGSRNLLEAKKLKAMGVSKGFLDIDIPFPTDCYHGLHIEFKRNKPTKGKLTLEQKEWMDYLNSKGYLAVVVYTLDEAIHVVELYLQGYKGRSE